MISFPNSKINIGLNIIRKRDDGYHDIETVFYPLPLTDVLEITPSKSEVTLTITGGHASVGSDNLCIKAYNLLKNDFPELPPVSIHLHKVIPTGAGLGGGSSDAAFMLHLLNKTFDRNIPKEKLFQYALTLGSDCPFFLLNKPCFATGRGEIMNELTFSLKNYVILLINPQIQVSTREAFALVKPTTPQIPLTEIIKHSPGTWKNILNNDFEKSIFQQYPELKKIKEKLYNDGAIYASMTGSGSTVYGLFDAKQTLPLFPDQYFYKVCKL